MAMKFQSLLNLTEVILRCGFDCVILKEYLDEHFYISAKLLACLPLHITWRIGEMWYSFA